MGERRERLGHVFELQVRTGVLPAVAVDLASDVNEHHREQELFKKAPAKQPTAVPNERSVLQLFRFYNGTP